LSYLEISKPKLRNNLNQLFAMKNILLTLAALASITASAQDYFNNEPCKMLFFSSFHESVEYIVIMNVKTKEVFGSVRNTEFENPLTFFTPGEFAALGVSVNSDGTYSVVTDPLFFEVNDNTATMSAIGL